MDLDLKWRAGAGEDIQPVADAQPIPAWIGPCSASRIVDLPDILAASVPGLCSTGKSAGTGPGSHGSTNDHSTGNRPRSGQNLGAAKRELSIRAARDT